MSERAACSREGGRARPGVEALRGRERPPRQGRGRQGRARGARGRVDCRREGRAARRGRPVGLRQVDDAPHRRRARGRRRRRRAHRRQVDEGRSSAGSRRRDGVPGLRALPADDGAREHRVPAEDAQGPAGRATEARRRGRRDAPARPPDGPAALGAVGRRATARGDGARDRAAPARLPLRRAALEPRRGAPAGPADRDRRRSCASSASRRSTSPTTRSRR